MTAYPMRINIKIIMMGLVMDFRPPNTLLVMACSRFPASSNDAMFQRFSPLETHRQSHSMSHDLPALGAPPRMCSPIGMREDTTKRGVSICVFRRVCPSMVVRGLNSQSTFLFLLLIAVSI